MLFWLFILVIGVQCGYALYFFVRVWRLPKTAPLQPSDRKRVSIIICAKNEAQNLERYLPAVLTQDYTDAAGKPMYEVIVVNDASTDDTARVLQEMELRYDHLWDVVVSESDERLLKGKKHALSKGVAIAQHDLLLLTDADCVPATDQWLALMTAPLVQGKEIVAGYGGYTHSEGLLNAFIRWETLHTFLQYSTYTMTGQPYMAVGRNMACTKDVLLRAQATDAWNALPSGDDDLLVSIAGNAENTAVVAYKEAFTFSAAKATFAEWVKQKQRHLSTGKYYKTPAKALLALYAVSHAIMWLLFIAILSQEWCVNTMVAMSIRCLLYWSVWLVAANRLGEKKLVYFFPFFDIGWMVYNFAFLPYITWKNKKNWK